MAGRRDFGRVRQLKSGKWQARYPGPDGVLRPAPRTFDRKSDATDWLAEKRTEILRDEWVDPDAGKVLLADFAWKWIAERKLADSTRERYESACRRQIVPRLGHLSISKIKEGRVRTWYRSCLDDGHGQASVAKAYRLLRAIFQTAADDRLISRNPCRIKGGGEDGTEEREPLSVNEVFAVADAIAPRWRLLVLFAAFTSLRFGELAALQRKHIDMSICEVSVRRSQAELRGGRRKIKEPKSKAGLRTVSIPKVIADDLANHLENFSESGAEGYVFVGKQGGRLRRHNFRKVWTKALADSGIGRTDVHFHDLRHTGNDLAAQAGATTKELMSRMGHTSVRAALIYQHASRERDRAIADSMSKKVRRARKKTPRPEGACEGHGG